MRVAQFFTGLLSLCGLSTAASYSNPLRAPEGSDPFMVWTGGYYYLMTTSWRNVQITRATTVEGLKTGERKVIYESNQVNRTCSVWAPEVHYLNQKWYVYYTAGRCQDLEAQSIHVLEGELQTSICNNFDSTDMI